MSDELRGLYDLGLRGEVYTALRRAIRPKFFLLQELLKLTPVQVLAIPGIGPKRYEHIVRTLKRHGLSLTKGVPK